MDAEFTPAETHQLADLHGLDTGCQFSVIPGDPTKFIQGPLQS